MTTVYRSDSWGSLESIIDPDTLEPIGATGAERATGIGYRDQHYIHLNDRYYGLPCAGEYYAGARWVQPRLRSAAYTAGPWMAHPYGATATERARGIPTTALVVGRWPRPHDTAETAPAWIGSRCYCARCATS